MPGTRMQAQIECARAKAQTLGKRAHIPRPLSHEAAHSRVDLVRRQLRLTQLHCGIELVHRVSRRNIPCYARIFGILRSSIGPLSTIHLDSCVKDTSKLERVPRASCDSVQPTNSVTVAHVIDVQRYLRALFCVLHSCRVMFQPLCWLLRHCSWR
jgi:hypothetical protein